MQTCHFFLVQTKRKQNTTLTFSDLINLFFSVQCLSFSFGIVGVIYEPGVKTNTPFSVDISLILLMIDRQNLQQRVQTFVIFKSSPYSD